MIEIVALARHRLKEIAVEEIEALGMAGFREIEPRHVKCLRRQFDGVNHGIGKDMGGQDGEASRAGAQIEHAADRR